jgi:two-component sensor histidine kinase
MSEAIVKRNAELEPAAIETRAMAREVNHCVKNNLQMILSLLGLQYARLPDAAARAVVTFREEDGARKLTIGDDGTGYDPVALDSRKMARDLMMGLARQLDAEMTTEAMSGGGVTIAVRFSAARVHS